MALTILENAHFRLTLDDPEGIVRYTRSALPFASGAEASESLHQMLAATRSLTRHHYALLTDVREAPGRNDEAFEGTLAKLRHELFDGFRKQATLVRTAVGRLQVERLARELRTGDSRAFESEAEALAYLLSPEPSPPRASARPARHL
ncbi:MAG: hypothetical protein JNK04_09960 [Myxococcales bacterium]|nr:hypothetical protein [Myxococcales bacterium]